MNKLRGSVLVALLAAGPLVALSALSGCEKPNDLPRLQDEAVATARICQQRLDELSHRATVLGPRVAALPSDAPDAARVRQIYQQALTLLDERRREIQQQLPVGVQAGMKSGNPEELIRLIARVRQNQERGATEATSELSAVESYVSLAEQRQIAPRPAAAAAPERATEPTTDDHPAAPRAPAR